MPMYFAYTDESGDSGYDRSPTDEFALSVVLIHDSDWLRALDRMVDMRRYMKDEFGIPVRAELKAHFLVHGKGPFRRLALDLNRRMDVYRFVLEAQCKLDLFRTWAIYIDKTKVQKRNHDPRGFAWRYMIERLDNFAGHEGENIKLFPDAGHGYFIRRLVRQMRRFHRAPAAFGSGFLEADATRILEDPSDRASHESYFIQLADLNVYAAARHISPNAKVGRDVWEELGDTRVEEVNKLRGGPVGIKVFPT